MMKTFLAAAAALALATLATYLVADHVGYRNYPGVPAALAERIQARQQVADDLIDGRMSFLEAADTFYCLNRQAPGMAGALPGETESEIACRLMLAHARAELERREGEAGAAPYGPGGALMARLEGELEAVRGSDGRVRLPGRGD